MRIRFAVDSWILEKWCSRCTCRKNNTIKYNNLLFYLLIIIIYYSSDTPSSLITESLSVLWTRLRTLRQTRFTVPVWLISPRRSVGFERIGNIWYYSISRPVDKGRLKERCGLESQTNFFPFKKSPKNWVRIRFENIRYMITCLVLLWTCQNIQICRDK